MATLNELEKRAPVTYDGLVAWVRDLIALLKAERDAKPESVGPDTIGDALALAHGYQTRLTESEASCRMLTTRLLETGAQLTAAEQRISDLIAANRGAAEEHETMRAKLEAAEQAEVYARQTATKVGVHAEREIDDLRTKLLAAESEAREARTKADQYERDWYDAKSEFGDAMAKAMARISELEAELSKLQAATPGGEAGLLRRLDPDSDYSSLADFVSDFHEQRAALQALLASPVSSLVDAGYLLRTLTRKPQAAELATSEGVPRTHERPNSLRSRDAIVRAARSIAGHSPIAGAIVDLVYQAIEDNRATTAVTSTKPAGSLTCGNMRIDEDFSRHDCVDGMVDGEPCPDCGDAPAVTSPMTRATSTKAASAFAALYVGTWHTWTDGEAALANLLMRTAGEARKAALDEAAKVCEGIADNWRGEIGMTAMTMSQAMSELATKFRALAATPTGAEAPR